MTITPEMTEWMRANWVECSKWVCAGIGLLYLRLALRASQ
jgi:hypothetical protein